jgi:hypothetical protein
VTTADSNHNFREIGPTTDDRKPKALPPREREIPTHAEHDFPEEESHQPHLVLH